MSTLVFAFCSIDACSTLVLAQYNFRADAANSEARFHCQPYRAVAIEPVSANRLLQNGNFCGMGWRLSGYSRSKLPIFGDRRLGYNMQKCP